MDFHNLHYEMIIILGSLR